MHIVLQKDHLVKFLGVGAKATTNNKTLPIISGVYIEARENKITLRSTNLNLSIECTYSADTEITIIEEGKIVVESSFINIIKKFSSGLLTLKTENNELIISNDTSTFAVTLLGDADSFPLPLLPDENSKNITLPYEQFSGMIRKVAFAAATDDSRPALKGIFFDYKDSILNIVALDGFRLSIQTSTISYDNNFKILVDSKSLGEIISLFSIEKDIVLTLSENHLFLSQENIKAYCNLLNEDYVPYERLLPNNFNFILKVNRLTLLESLERAFLISKESGNLIIFKLPKDEKKIELSCTSSHSKLKEVLQVNTKNPVDLTIGFNFRYILDVLKVCESEEINFRFISESSPLVITEEKESNAFLILPVRLKVEK